MINWQSCLNRHQCLGGNRFGKGCFEDPAQSAAGGKPWQECHCGIDEKGDLPMTDNVVKFYSLRAALSPDVVLEQSAGVYEEVLVIGYNKDGELDVRASLNFDMKSIFFALEAFKHQVLSGEFGHRLEEKP